MKDLIREVSENTGYRKIDIAIVLDEFFGVVVDNVALGNDVRIKRFIRISAIEQTPSSKLKHLKNYREVSGPRKKIKIHKLLGLRQAEELLNREQAKESS